MFPSFVVVLYSYSYVAQHCTKKKRMRPNRKLQREEKEDKILKRH